MPASDILRVAAFAACWSLASSAGATSQRTFVASVGGDSNPCSLKQPCRSFNAAIAQTNDSGEVIVLDSAGYGKVTIAKSITIAAPAGIYAGISVFAGDDGVVINGANVVVSLRGLSINGQGGNNGINLVNGRELSVERCEITGMGAAGIAAALSGGSLYVRDSTVARNFGSGVAVSGPGSASLDRIRASSNVYGIQILDGTSAAIRDSAVEDNSLGISVRAETADARISIQRSRLFRNCDEGLQVSAPGAFVASAVVVESEVVRNNHCLGSGGGISVSGFTGTARVSLARTTVSYNDNKAIFTLGTNAVAYLEDCVFAENTGFGIYAYGGVIYTRGNNTVQNTGVNGNVQLMTGQ